MPDTPRQLTENEIAEIAARIAQAYSDAVACTFEPSGYTRASDVLLDFAEVLAMSIRDSSLATELLGAPITRDELQSMQARCTFRPIASE